MKSLAVFLVAASSVCSAFPGIPVKRNGLSCSFDDPLKRLEDVQLNATNLRPIFTLDTGAVRSNLLIQGLSAVQVHLKITNIHILTVEGSLEIPELSLKSSFKNADGIFDITPVPNDCFPSGAYNFSIKGEYLKVKATGFKIKFQAILFDDMSKPSVTIRTLNITSFELQDLAVKTGKTFKINGETVDWKRVNSGLPSCLVNSWTNDQTVLTENIRRTINTYKLSWNDLVDLLDCGAERNNYIIDVN